MIQWRLMSCAATAPVLAIVIVYANTYWLREGSDWSARYAVFTATVMSYFPDSAIGGEQHFRERL